MERKLAGALKIVVIDDIDADFPDSLGHAIGDRVRVGYCFGRAVAVRGPRLRSEFDQTA